MSNPIDKDTGAAKPLAQSSGRPANSITAHPAIPPFGHHFINLQPTARPGKRGNVPAAIKEACRASERLHGALHLTSNKRELVVTATSPDLFDGAPGQAVARRQLWGAMEESTRLIWVVPTSDPEAMRASLPENWGGGYKNVCICIDLNVVADPEIAIKSLLAMPSRYRMVLISSASGIPALAANIPELSWVVVAGGEAQQDLARGVEVLCRQAEVPFLFYRTDLSKVEVQTTENIEDIVHPLHPFGPEVDLTRPALQTVDGDSQASRGGKPGKSKAAAATSEKTQKGQYVFPFGDPCVSAGGHERQLEQPADHDVDDAAKEPEVPDEAGTGASENSAAEAARANEKTNGSSAPASGQTATKASERDLKSATGADEVAAEPSMNGGVNSEEASECPPAPAVGDQPGMSPASDEPEGDEDARNESESPAVEADDIQQITTSSAGDRREFKRLDRIVRNGMASFIETGIALKEIHDRKLWAASDCKSWERYVRGICGMSKQQAHRLIDDRRRVGETVTTW